MSGVCIILISEPKPLSWKSKSQDQGEWTEWRVPSSFGLLAESYSCTITDNYSTCFFTFRYCSFFMVPNLGPPRCLSRRAIQPVRPQHKRQQAKSGTESDPCIIHPTVSNWEDTPDRRLSHFDQGCFHLLHLMFCLLCKDLVGDSEDCVCMLYFDAWSFSWVDAGYRNVFGIASGLSEFWSTNNFFSSLKLDSKARACRWGPLLTPFPFGSWRLAWPQRAYDVDHFWPVWAHHAAAEIYHKWFPPCVLPLSSATVSSVPPCPLVLKPLSPLSSACSVTTSQLQMHLQASAWNGWHRCSEVD